MVPTEQFTLVLKCFLNVEQLIFVTRRHFTTTLTASDFIITKDTSTTHFVCKVFTNMKLRLLELSGGSRIFCLGG